MFDGLLQIIANHSNEEKLTVSTLYDICNVHMYCTLLKYSFNAYNYSMSIQKTY